MQKPIEEYTDGELMSVIRQAENTDISGSQYQKAKNEWDMRQQVKIAQATEKKRGGIFFEVGGNMINDGAIHTAEGATVDVSVAGDYTSNKGKIYQGKGPKDETLLDKFFWLIIVPVLVVVIGGFILHYFGWV
ncbi:MAG: hypothetical protein PHV93_03630 [Candidatus Pacebacteria bacterium]|nr:hypothetical protein [Candidatus Paceibacterota bacterium]